MPCSRAAFLAVIAATSVFPLLSAGAQDRAVKLPGAAPYTWKSVAIGGGGYVLDVVCHPRQKDLVYLRTDVGGCYRWDAKNRQWTAITDGFSEKESNYYGGEALAADPNDPNVVYIAAGKYTASWAPKGALFKSGDQGQTWKKLPLALKMGSNENHRTCGPRLAVSPHRGAVVLFGSRRDGLWRSGDGGDAWTKAAGFGETVGTDGIGVTSVVFDPRSPQTVYAAAFNSGVFVSRDEGKTWELMPGSPRGVERLALTADGGALYATHQKGIGKYAGGRWSDVTPPGQTGSFGGLSVNPRDSRDVIATAQKDRLTLFRSRDGGMIWERRRYTVQSSVPWHSGSMRQIQYAAGLTFDPLVAGRVWLTDWYATYHTDNIDADPILLTNDERGHEELVVFSLAAPPVGHPLLSGVADVDGFAHTDLDTFPANGFGAYYGGSGAAFGDTYQIVCCPSDPKRIIRVSGKRWDNTGGGMISRDGGATWAAFPTWDAKVVPARVAVSPTDTENMVVLQIGSGPALCTRDGGATWQNVVGLPDKLIPDAWNWQVPLAADGATGGTFYVAANGTLYRSTDSGATFAPAAPDLAGGGQTFVATVPGKAGEIWVSNQSGLRHSLDGGKTFTLLPSVRRSRLFALGKPSPGTQAPTLFLMGVLADGRDGIFRSVDGGVTWLTISDPRLPIGDEPNSMTASARTFGLVFIGTNGRGVYYGQPSPDKQP